MELSVETLGQSLVDAALVHFFQGWGITSPEVLARLAGRVRQLTSPLMDPDALLSAANGLVQAWWENLELGAPFGEGARAAFVLAEVGQRWPEALLSTEVPAHVKLTLRASQLVPMPASHPAPMPEQNLAPEGWVLRLWRWVRAEPADAGTSTELPW
jgi:hypothetical protein